MKTENTHWRKIMNTKFLSGDELPKDGVVRVIKGWKEESFFSPKSRQNEDHITIEFVGIDKHMILTNRKAKEISKVIGSPQMADWINKEVLLIPISEKHFGEVFQVIHVRTAEKKVLPNLTPTSEGWDKAKVALASGSTTIAGIRKYYVLSEADRLELEKK